MILAMRCMVNGSDVILIGHRKSTLERFRHHNQRLRCHTFRTTQISGETHPIEQSMRYNFTNAGQVSKRPNHPIGDEGACVADQ